MKTLSGIILLFVFILSASLIAQAQVGWEVDPMPIRLKGQIVSAGDEMPVPYAHIVNTRTHGGTTSNSGGYFTLDMLNVDSLYISSMGFLKYTFNVPANYNSDSILTIYIQPINFAIQEVRVEGEKNRVNIDGIPSGKPVNIDPELRGDAFNNKPPLVAAFFNPLSYWQYYLSKKEKRKRAVREAMALERNWEMHSQNYNKDMVMMLTGMNEKQAEEFMVWFNSLNILPYIATEYEVRASIRKYYEIYWRQGRLR